MWWFVRWALDFAAPVFLVMSPIMSYGDQIYSIHRTKTSAGFSLDIPLIMLVASIFKVFYWFGSYYSRPLLLQAMSMIGVQTILLKVALDNRPPPGAKEGIEHVPFSGQSQITMWRPYGFWQWTSSRPYWNSLLYLCAGLLAVHILIPPIARSEPYIELLGFAGLGVEAFLPVPQIIANQRARSCKGFRFSVLGAWLLGDVMKMSYFFLSGSKVPFAFRFCGVLQCLCDLYLAFQYFTFGNGLPIFSHSRSQSASVGDGSERWAMKETDVRMG